MLWNAIIAAGIFNTSLRAYRWRPLPYTFNYEDSEGQLFTVSLVHRLSEEEVRDDCPAKNVWINLLIHLYISPRVYKYAI